MNYEELLEKRKPADVRKPYHSRMTFGGSHKSCKRTSRVHTRRKTRRGTYRGGTHPRTHRRTYRRTYPISYS